MDVQNKEEKIYAQLLELQNGDNKDKSFAFECIGYLTNEVIEDSLEKRLRILEQKIIVYKQKRQDSK
ncbi:MAG: hypothetical protein GX758_03670 [Tenericutes bacterium]|nr:hypothetical protein [Mycoplasmatota bacterium]